MEETKILGEDVQGLANEDTQMCTSTTYYECCHLYVLDIDVGATLDGSIPETIVILHCGLLPHSTGNSK